MTDIEAGLKTLVEEVLKRNIHSIAIPPLGCGLGGLRWADVRAKVEGLRVAGRVAGRYVASILMLRILFF